MDPRLLAAYNDELAYLRESARDCQGSLQRVSADDHDPECGERFDYKDDREHAEDEPG